MGTELAQFELEGGGKVVVEVEERPGIARIARDGRSLQHASSSFQGALQEVREAASAVLDQFRSMPNRPDSVEVTFGLTLDAQVGAVVARGGVAANFQVALTWNAS